MADVWGNGTYRGMPGREQRTAHGTGESGVPGTPEES